MTRSEMRQFILLADRFRRTPVVDDDFPLMRDRFDFALADLLRLTEGEFPTTVTLCGSTRFMDAFVKAARDETLAGKIVLSVGMFGHQEGIDMGGPVKAALDQLHLRKVDACDEVLILNVLCPRCPACKAWWKALQHETIPFPACECHAGMEKAGYVGDSTRRELAYAQKLGKVIRYLNPQEQEAAP